MFCKGFRVPCPCARSFSCPYLCPYLFACPYPVLPLQVSPEVLSQMKAAMVASASGAAASHSFLLDDDSSLPFQAQDLLATVDDKVGKQYRQYNLCSMGNYRQ